MIEKYPTHPPDALHNLEAGEPDVHCGDLLPDLLHPGLPLPPHHLQLLLVVVGGGVKFLTH